MRLPAFVMSPAKRTATSEAARPPASCPAIRGPDSRVSIPISTSCRSRLFSRERSRPSASPQRTPSPHREGTHRRHRGSRLYQRVVCPSVHLLRKRNPYGTSGGPEKANPGLGKEDGPPNHGVRQVDRAEVDRVGFDHRHIGDLRRWTVDLFRGGRKPGSPASPLPPGRLPVSRTVTGTIRRSRFSNLSRICAGVARKSSTPWGRLVCARVMVKVRGPGSFTSEKSRTTIVLLPLRPRSSPRRDRAFPAPRGPPDRKRCRGRCPRLCIARAPRPASRVPVRRQRSSK